MGVTIMTEVLMSSLHSWFFGEITETFNIDDNATYSIENTHQQPISYDYVLYSYFIVSRPVHGFTVTTRNLDTWEHSLVDG